MLGMWGERHQRFVTRRSCSTSYNAILRDFPEATNAPSFGFRSLEPTGFGRRSLWGASDADAHLDAKATWLQQSITITHPFARSCHEITS